MKMLYQLILKSWKKNTKKDFRYLNANQIQEKIFQWLFNIWKMHICRMCPCTKKCMVYLFWTSVFLFLFNFILFIGKMYLSRYRFRCAFKLVSFPLFLRLLFLSLSLSRTIREVMGSGWTNHSYWPHWFLPSIL